jgi:hypothetical protein
VDERKVHNRLHIPRLCGQCDAEFCGRLLEAAKPQLQDTQIVMGLTCFGSMTMAFWNCASA